MKQTHRIDGRNSTSSLRIAFALVACSLAPGFTLARAQAPGQMAGAASMAAPSQATVPPFNGIAHIAIRVKDIAASVAFYNKLGFEQAFAMTKDGVVTQSFLKINDKQFIELYPVSGANPAAGFLHLCFEGADLNAIHDRYVADGLTPIAVRKAGAGNLLFTLKGPLQFADPQNIEYTQYQPGSLHTNDVGLHLGPDRIADRMTVVTLAMEDPIAARAFYLDKLGFAPAMGAAAAGNSGLLDLPGGSGEEIEIVPVDTLGSRSSIVLETGNLKRAADRLEKQGVAAVKSKAALGATDPKSKAIKGERSQDILTVTDPDGNLIRIASARP